MLPVGKINSLTKLEAILPIYYTLIFQVSYEPLNLNLLEEWNVQ